MTHTFIHQSDDVDTLRKRSDIATAFQSKIFSALTAIVFRERGEKAVNDLWYRTLSSHQGDRYEEGLRKLGIHDDPPAVAAAKYHYFTNIIGGLNMEYVEESQQKVWIRYRAPMWMYAGVGLIAMPASIRRTVFSAWHAMNGRYMGCAALGYVGTKFSMEGDPYDEGYFIEHDRPLSADELLKFEVVISTPEFDPTTAPILDLDLWPEARILKARPKFSAGYVRATVDAMYWAYGAFATHLMVSSAMRMLAIQMTPELAAKTGAAGTSVADVADFHATLLGSCRRQVAVEHLSTTASRLVIGSHEPFDESYPADLHRAFFEFHSMATRVLNGHLSITATPRPDRTEVWEINDEGKWLW